MAVMDEFRKEREALRHGTLRQKFQYFMDYYKWPVIGGTAALCCAGSLIYHFFAYQETAFYAALLNSAQLQPSESYAAAFMEYAGLPSSKGKALFDSSFSITFDSSSPEAADEVYYSSREKLNLMITVGELDAIVSNDELFGHLANSGIFRDLRTCLTPEQQESYAPYFYYVDKPLMEQIMLAESNMNDFFQPALPDPFCPERMEEPVPVGIRVEADEKLAESFYVRGEGIVVAGIVTNAPHPDIAAKYLEYLMLFTETSAHIHTLYSIQNTLPALRSGAFGSSPSM